MTLGTTVFVWLSFCWCLEDEGESAVSVGAGDGGEEDCGGLVGAAAHSQPVEVKLVSCDQKLLPTVARSDLQAAHCQAAAACLVYPGGPERWLEGSAICPSPAGRRAAALWGYR